MQKILASFAVAVALSVSPVFAEVSDYKLIKQKSFVKFYAIQNSAPVQGRFDEFSTDIKFSPDAPAQSVIKVDVDTSSVRTAHEDVAKNLKITGMAFC